MVFREGRKWLEAKRQNQSHNWAKLFKKCVSHLQKHVWCLMNLSRTGNAEPSLKAAVLQWVLGVVCRRALCPLSSIAPVWSQARLCPAGMLILEFQPRNTSKYSCEFSILLGTFYWEDSVQYVFVSISTAAFTLFCRQFPSWSRGWHSLKTSWRNVLRISRKSFRRKQTDFLKSDRSWRHWEVWYCVPNRLCVTCFNKFEHNLFFNWNV